MIAWLRHLLGWLIGAFRSRQDLVLENLALRQQLLTLHAQRPRRRFTTPQKLFWVLLRKGWAGWRRPLMLVTPRTVVGWHRAGFRLYWKWISRAEPNGGRKPVSKEIRALIFQMVAENPTWGAPRIHGGLLMPKWQRELFKTILDEQNLRFDRDGRPRTAYSLRHTYICLRLMEGADIYQIAKNCRTSVEMIEKYYAAHIKTSLDAAAINVMRPKKNQRGRKAIQSTQALPQPLDNDGTDR
jgi:hypothetical protein